MRAAIWMLSGATALAVTWWFAQPDAAEQAALATRDAPVTEAPTRMLRAILNARAPRINPLKGEPSTGEPSHELLMVMDAVVIADDRTWVRCPLHPGLPAIDLAQVPFAILDGDSLWMVVDAPQGSLDLRPADLPPPPLPPTDSIDAHPMPSEDPTATMSRVVGQIIANWSEVNHPWILRATHPVAIVFWSPSTDEPGETRCWSRRAPEPIEVTVSVVDPKEQASPYAGVTYLVAGYPVYVQADADGQVTILVEPSGPHQLTAEAAPAGSIPNERGTVKFWALDDAVRVTLGRSRGRPVPSPRKAASMAEDALDATLRQLEAVDELALPEAERLSLQWTQRAEALVERHLDRQDSISERLASVLNLPAPPP